MGEMSQSDAPAFESLITNDAPSNPYASSKFKQQRLSACRPFLTPCWAAVILGLLSISSLILGIVYILESNSIAEIVIPYGDQCKNISECNLSFGVPTDMSPPIFVYYQLTHFYQNNFLYSDSKVWKQLEGKSYSSPSDLKKCAPVITNGSEPFKASVYAPCGSVARSIFTDSYSFGQGFPNVTESGISLKSFRQMFAPASSIYNESIHWMLPQFPGEQINEHFVNWMQIAPFPKFRKLWGKITSTKLPKGSYNMTIYNNYDVNSFGGTKSVVISDVSWIGGKNNFFGIFFVVICAICGITAIALVVFYSFNILPLYKALASSNGILGVSLVA